MQIQKDYSLVGLNTFGINAKAKYFVEINNEEELGELFSSSIFKENNKIFLGGGSNILFTKDFGGIVVLNKLKGVNIVEEDDDHVFVRSAGGEKWHDLVIFAVDHGYWGVENLSLIPGTVGAAPIQNIGAYGVEINDVLFSVEAYETENGSKKTFRNDECNFGYRESIFKNELKGKYFISAVTLKLNKKENKNASYKSLADYFKKNAIVAHVPKEVSDAVIAIRKSKLPDPENLGSAGSFFKNVYVGEEKLKELQRKYPDIPSFNENERIKIPAGWLIEQCGWKGKKIGNVGVYEKQALVLVNHGEATGEEILGLANAIITSVKEKFNLELSPEVNLI